MGGAPSVLMADTVAGQEADGENGAVGTSRATDLEGLAASILYQLLVLGGTQPEEAMREIRRRARLVARVTGGIDVASWGERFAQVAAPQQRTWLLDMAVQCVAARTTPVPLRQYSALLDLSFSLGFQTDALARLREQYGFDYIDPARDPARNGRGRETAAAETPKRELLRVLGIEEGVATRQVIIATYRRLAAQHHPDRVHFQPEDVQSAAAARFIEITRAYETLLGLYRE